MISLSKLRMDLFKVFSLMRDHGLELEFYHRRTIYRLVLYETGRRVEAPYTRTKKASDKRMAKKVLKHHITTEECPQCHNLLVVTRTGTVCFTNDCVGPVKDAPPLE